MKHLPKFREGIQYRIGKVYKNQKPEDIFYSSTPEPFKNFAFLSNNHLGLTGKFGLSYLPFLNFLVLPKLSWQHYHHKD